MLMLSYLASGDCSPMQAVIGSITAQEVMKVRKYLPVYLIFYT